MMMTLAAVTFVIFVLAFVFSMLGLGGAMLYIPILHWFGFDFKTVAIPAGLLLNGITALSAAIYYLRAKMVDIKGSLPLIFASFVGAPVGAYFTTSFPTRMLIFLFSLAMALAGGRMLLTSGRADKEQMLSYKWRLLLMGIGGFFIGFIAGFLGVGGGFLFVPMMLIIGYKTKQAAATSSFVVIFSSFSGFAGHVAEGHFYWPLMVATTIAVIIGSQIGAKVMKERMRARWIKQMFAVLLLGVAVKLLWNLFM
jgi:uncharacterized membrane protein YfcA